MIKETDWVAHVCLGIAIRVGPLPLVVSAVVLRSDGRDGTAQQNKWR